MSILHYEIKYFKYLNTTQITKITAINGTDIKKILFNFDFFISYTSFTSFVWLINQRFKIIKISVSQTGSLPQLKALNNLYRSCS